MGRKISQTNLESQAKSEAIYQPRTWLAILGAATIVRACVAASHPLFETEAYYWTWSRHLALGYYDHPPMVAYFIRFTDFFGPPHSLSARLHAVLAHFLASVLLYYLGRNLLGSTSLGVRTALIFNVIPIFSLSAIQNQPDVPLIVFWCATLLCFERALGTGKGFWWILAGISTGGAMLSKYHGFFYLACLGLYLLCSAKDRRYFLTPWPYLAFLVAALVYAPNFWWNATHDWIAYDFQLFRHAGQFEFKLKHVVGTTLLPLIYLSPWIYLVILAAVWRSFRLGVVKGDRIWALAFWTSAPLFLFFLAVSLGRNVKIHWPATAFIAMCPALALWLEGWSARGRIWLYSSAGLLSVLLYAYLIVPFPLSQLLPQSSAEVITDRADRDWSAQLFGWTELGDAVRAEIEKGSESAPTFVVARRFDRVAAVAFYAGRPELGWVMDPGENYDRQSDKPDPRSYLLWQAGSLPVGANVIYILKDRKERRRRAEIKQLREWFEEVSDPIELRVERDGRLWRRWYYLLCERFIAQESE